MKVLVVGGTGMLGKPVALEFVAQGFEVRVMSTQPDAARKKLPAQVEVVKGDVADIASITRALEGCDGVHVNLSGGPTIEDYMAIEYQGTVNVLDAAESLGVSKFSFLSGFSVAEENCGYIATKAKYLAEERIRDSAINYTIFRATWFMESMDLFKMGSRLMKIGKQTAPLSWLAAQDYSLQVVRCFKSPELAPRKTLYIYGPEKFSMDEAIDRYVANHKPSFKTLKLPIWLVSLLGKLGDAKMADTAEFMAYMQNVSEAGCAREAQHLLGKAETTFETWMDTQGEVKK